jgi:hypothetical protein
MSELKPFLVRLRPDVVELLIQAAKMQQKPQAVIINELLRDGLSKTGDLDSRINRLLG